WGGGGGVGVERWVGGGGNNFGSPGAQRGGNLVEPVLGAGRHRHPRPFLGRQLCQAAPDATGGAGNEDAAAAQVPFHRSPLLPAIPEPSIRRTLSKFTRSRCRP